MMSKSHLSCNAATVAALACAAGPIKNLITEVPRVPSEITGALERAGALFMPDGNPAVTVLRTVIGMACFFLGTLLPDVDNRNSMLGRYVYIPIGHRTITHTAWAVAVFALAGLRLWPLTWLALGYFLHLFYDMFSVQGVCWLWPLSRYRKYPGGATVKARRLLPGLYHAGKPSEGVFVAVTCGFWACVTAWGAFMRFAA